jgi:uncharacterized cysteine cluster protein YcgN (CxxCxxCC family)
MNDQYWKRKSLADMTAEEWEGLCDGCALCCVHKLEDEETGEVYYTDVACRLLDLESCRCCDYANREAEVEECFVLSPANTEMFGWLPATCAYRRVANGQDLPEWHPLVTGDPESVHRAGISLRGKAVSENDTQLYTVLQKLGD